MSETLPAPQLPAGQTEISIKEAAKLLEPLLPSAPLSERRRASITEESQLTQTELTHLLRKATVEGDFDTGARLVAQHRERGDDSLYDDVTTSVRQIISLPKELLNVARSLKVPLIHPTLGIVSLTEPNENFFIDRDGFQKITDALLCRVAARRTPQRRKSGPPAAVRQSATNRMVTDLRSGKVSADGLSKLTLESLVAEYGMPPGRTKSISANTLNAARADALAKFSELQNSATLKNAEH